jgi:hypothetical protein
MQNVHSSQNIVDLLKTRSLVQGYSDVCKLTSLGFGAATLAFGVVYPDLPIEARLYTLGMGGLLTGLTGTAWRTFNQLGDTYSQKVDKILEKHHLVPINNANEQSHLPVVQTEDLHSQVEQAATVLKDPNISLETKVAQRSLLTSLRDRLTIVLEGWLPSQGVATRPQGKPSIEEGPKR